MHPKNPWVEIFSQGEELLSGQTVDTNATWLSEKLVEMGFCVARHTAVGDRLGDLVSLLTEISHRADCCICTGGLGPTQDDLTAEAVSVAFDRVLDFDQNAFDQIKKFFSRLGRTMPDVNRKQAMIPRGATRLDNSWGTAPGFCFNANRCWFVCVPGVPYEMRNFFREQIKAQLLSRFQLNPQRLVTLRTVGIGESGIQQKLMDLALPKNVMLSFRTGNLENQTKLLFPPDFSEADLRAFVLTAAQTIGKQVFSIDGLDGDGGSLVDVLDSLISRAGLTLAVIETVSGGQIASRCAMRNWFSESWTVREISKIFDHYELEAIGFENPEKVGTALVQLATRARDKLKRDIVLVQLWSENWDALNDKNQAIQLYTGLATADGCFYYSCAAGGPPPRKQTVAATVALDTLRRYLQKLL